MKFELLALAERKPDFFSRRIQAGIKAPYSHCAILITYDTGAQEVVHAVAKGVIKQTLAEVYAWENHVIRRRVEIPVGSADYARGWLDGRLGTPYSVIQFLGFIFPFLRWIPFIGNGRREVVCSEFGAEFVCDCTGRLDLQQIACKAYGTCDWIDPKQALDIAAGIFGETPCG